MCRQRPVIIVNALQYVAVLAGFLVFPLIMTREAHVSADVADSVLSWSMIILAVGTTLQALPKGPIGSGYLAPSVMTAVYVSPSLEAVRLGGLALMGGMTMFGGAVEAVLSRSMHRLRSLLPPELAGVVILLVAIGNGMVGYRYLLAPGTEHADPCHWAVATITLLVTIALNVWGKGIVRASCALIGMIVGYAAAFPAGLVHQQELAQLAGLPPVQLPHVDYFAWSFDPVLIAPFLIAALANTLKAAALLTAAEKFADADWVRPNLKKIGGGVLADGITTALSGAFCVFGVNVSASSVGLSEATGRRFARRRLCDQRDLRGDGVHPRPDALLHADAGGGDRCHLHLHLVRHHQGRHRDDRLAHAGRPAHAGGGPGDADRPCRRGLSRLLPRAAGLDRASGRLAAGTRHVRRLRPECRIPHRHAPPRGAAHRSACDRLRRDPQLHGRPRRRRGARGAT